jgi:hypothetical protein
MASGFRQVKTGLIKRVAGPCVRPWVRCTIARALLGGGHLAGSRAIGGSSENSVGIRAVAAQCGPPQQIVDHRPGRRLQLGLPDIDIAALVVSPQGGARDVDRRADRGELKLDRR